MKTITIDESLIDNFNLFSSTKTYDLTDHQHQLVDSFLDFLHSDAKEITISGAAGTGKTYIMDYIYNEAMREYYAYYTDRDEEPELNDVLLSATTNKAAAVLSDRVGFPVPTIHSLLNLIVINDFKTGETKITRTQAWEQIENKLVIIDECSMIDMALYYQINKTLVNCKLVFVGDKSQLPPIKEDLSQVYNKDIEMLELVKPMRNSNKTALVNLCSQLRETVETGVFKPIEQVDGVIDYVDDDQMQEAIQHYFTELNPDARILAYSNDRVIDYNNYVRKLRNLPDDITVGEIVLNNSACKVGKGIYKTVVPVDAEVEILSVTRERDVKIKDVTLPVYELSVNISGVGSFEGVLVPKSSIEHRKLIKLFSSRKDWANYYKLQEQFMDLRLRDACTVHKSQGSTYDAALIDLGNIGLCTNPDLLARMLYVAVSRAKSRIFLFGSLPKRYN